MDKFLVALATSLVSALAFLAYKHPRPFARIANTLDFTSLAVYTLITVWYVATLQMKSAIYTAAFQAKDLPAESKEIVGRLADQIVQEINLPMLPLAIGYFAWSTYLFILSRLPQIHELKDEKSVD